MNKKQLKKTAALGLAGAMLLGTIMTVSAENPEDNPAVTDTKVNFVAGEIDITDPPLPIPDPDPDEELVPPLTPGGDKYLAVFAPEFDFGSVEIVDQDREYPVKAQALIKGKDKMPPDSIRYIHNYMAVIDQRGAHTGWNVEVKMDEPFKTTKSGSKNETLPGISIILKNGTLKSNTDGVGVNGLTGIGTGEAGVEIEPGRGGTKIFYADDDFGHGTYIQSFGNPDESADALIPQVDVTSTAQTKPNVKDATGADMMFNKNVLMSVPRGTNPDAAFYSTSLIWTISDTPNLGT